MCPGSVFANTAAEPSGLPHPLLPLQAACFHHQPPHPANPPSKAPPTTATWPLNRWTFQGSARYMPPLPVQVVSGEIWAEARSDQAILGKHTTSALTAEIGLQVNLWVVLDANLGCTCAESPTLKEMYLQETEEAGSLGQLWLAGPEGASFPPANAARHCHGRPCAPCSLGVFLSLDFNSSCTEASSWHLTAAIPDLHGSDITANRAELHDTNAHLGATYMLQNQGQPHAAPQD
ncbi:hypothetical protein P7K49_011960 [Saguinus oedipus]|uniref:Uncharacterized protein n=1 Tax=Saguinus oedipus TaxID=9490 RepID=A0ABQ9VS51_SAGOE|nr:hypothetical protein P7K49_011960 [Saguinus oedipus]